MLPAVNRYNATTTNRVVAQNKMDFKLITLARNRTVRSKKYKKKMYFKIS